MTALVRPVEHPLGHLDLLESLAIFIIREVAAESERPVLLFSGGKDSAVLLHLAAKAFKPGKIPFPVLHVDTGHNFPEVLDYRDAQVEAEGARLIVAKVQDSIDQGRVADPGPVASRNRLQTTTLLDAINAHGFDAAFGGARRDEDKARAKERVLSFRDSFGQWDPKAQRPELWQLYQGSVRPGEHLRAFPLSDWTELDIWQYIRREQIELPSIYYAHQREVRRAGRHAPGRQRVGGPGGRRAGPQGDRALPHGRGRHLHRCRAVRLPTPWRRSSARSRRHEFPSGARPGRTTASPRPPWRTASARGTSRPMTTLPGSPPAGGPELGVDTMDLLRFATIGSVDDGKSTLIGRLLFDTRQLFDDQLTAIETASERRGLGEVDLSFVTDGLRAEREQGITIDVAYRYAATPHRKFVIADCPGHIQYTRNMATGASTADLALVLVDATSGLREQSRRHICIAALLGVDQLVVCANKMDLVDWDRSAYQRIADDMEALAHRLGIASCTVIPIAALHGDNVVTRSDAAPWYDGPTVLDALESARAGGWAAQHGVQPGQRGPTPGAVGAPPARRGPELRRHGERRALPRRRPRRGAPARRPDDDPCHRDGRRPPPAGRGRPLGLASARRPPRRVAGRPHCSGGGCPRGHRYVRSDRVLVPGPARSPSGTASASSTRHE